MKFTLTLDKITKNFIHRYSDGSGHNLYLTQAEAAELGTPEKITIEITTE